MMSRSKAAVAMDIAREQLSVERLKIGPDGCV